MNLTDMQKFPVTPTVSSSFLLCGFVLVSFRSRQIAENTSCHEVVFFFGIESCF